MERERRLPLHENVALNLPFKVRELLRAPNAANRVGTQYLVNELGPFANPLFQSSAGGPWTKRHGFLSFEWSKSAITVVAIDYHVHGDATLAEKDIHAWDYIPMLCYDWEERGYVVVARAGPESYYSSGHLAERDVVRAHYLAILLQLMFRSAALQVPHVAYLVLEAGEVQTAPLEGFTVPGGPRIRGGTDFHPAWRVAYNPRHYLFEARIGPFPAIDQARALRPLDFELGVRFAVPAPDSHPLRLALSVRDGFAHSGQARAFAARPGRATPVQDLVQNYAHRPARLAEVLGRWAGSEPPPGPFLPAGSTRHRETERVDVVPPYDYSRGHALSVVAFDYPVGVAQFEVAAKAGVAGPKTSPVGVIPLLCYDWNEGGFVVVSDLGIDSSRDGKSVAYTDVIAVHYLAFLMQKMHDELQLPPPSIAYLILRITPRKPSDASGFHRIDYDPRSFLAESLPDRYSMISPPSELDFLEQSGEDAR